MSRGMNPDRWQRTKNLYQTALETDPELRKEFLAEACGEDDALRAEVESLLSFDDSGRDFLETSAFEVMAESLAEEELAPQAPGGRSLIGQRVSHFQILEKIGAGGMGAVYKAEDTRLHRFVALKFLPEDLELHPRAFERFRQEAQAASALNHPNICTVYDIGESEGRPFIAMELLEGKTLRHWLSGEPGGEKDGEAESRGGGLPLEMLLDLGLQVTDALDATHARGIIHRDIKPQNIFVVPRGEKFQAKVLDFGIAQHVMTAQPEAAGEIQVSDDDGTNHTTTLASQLMGTPSYLSPEQARRETIDTRTDLFSLGSVLYEMASGRQAFPVKPERPVLDAIVMYDPPSLTTLRPEIPEELAGITRKAMEKDRELRYQTASDLRGDLQRLKEETEMGRAWARPWWRDGRLWVGLGACLVVALVVAAFHLFRPPSAKAQLGFHRRDWVLVGRFDNLTGNPVLDGTVKFAVARELSNSHFVSVVSPDRVQGILRLMEMPANTPLKREVARQICVRDGGIRAFIVGRVNKIGSKYVLSASVVNPATDVQVAGAETQAADLNGILPAVHKLTNELRASLGEDLTAIQASDQGLEKVTTPSLRALQLYSQAYKLAIDVAPQRKPIPLLEQAIAEDPNFASAHNLLAWCYNNTGQKALADVHFRKAFELASTVSERERLFIQGSYYEVYKHDTDKAIEKYAALVRLYPNDFWGARNLTIDLAKEGRWGEWSAAVARQVNYEPASFRTNVASWWGEGPHGTAPPIGSMAESQPFFPHIARLLTPQVEKAHPFNAWNKWNWIAESDIKRGKIEAAYDIAERHARMSPPKDINAGEGDHNESETVRLLKELGAVKRAGELEQLRVMGSHFYYVGNADFCPYLKMEERTSPFGVGKYKSDLEDGRVPILFLQCGMMRQARWFAGQYRALYYKWKRRPFFPPEWVDGNLAFAEGHNAEAIRLLKKFLSMSLLGPKMQFQQIDFEAASLFPLPWDVLATAYEREGKLQDAIQTLQPAEEEGYLGPYASYHLYRLYLKVGDANNAQAVRAELLHRLSYADPDFPVLVALKKGGSHPPVLDNPLLSGLVY